MDEGAHRARQAGAAQRLLRPAGRADLPHPNACLSCDNFLTDGSFRAVHEQQLEHTRQLREHAQRDGRLRLAELLERDEHSLTHILEGRDDIDAEQHERDPAAAPVEPRHGEGS